MSDNDRPSQPTPPSPITVRLAPEARASAAGDASRYQPDYDPRAANRASATAGVPGLSATVVADATGSETIVRHRGEVWGDFELGEMIGRGGMGVVYKARQLSLERWVAVKVLPSHLSQHQALCARFEQEARSVAMINSPHVVQVFTVGRHLSHHFFAMELVEGQDLGHRLKSGWRPTPDEVVALMIQAARGLAAAGAGGIVHRDIKPGNLMLTTTGVLKVMDFGLARVMHATDSLSTSGEIKGTGWYMSPEQCRGLPCDARSDVYSLGVVFFELLTRRRPFLGDTFMELIRMHTEEPPPVPSRLVPAVSHACEAVVLQCLAKRPEDRYQSAADLADDLERLRAHQRTFAERRRSAPLRHGLGAAALIVAGAAAMLTWHLRTPATEPNVAATENALHAHQPGTPSSAMVTAPTPAATAVPLAHEITPPAAIALPAPTPSPTAVAQPAAVPPIAAAPSLPAPQPAPVAAAASHPPTLPATVAVPPPAAPAPAPATAAPDPVLWSAWMARFETRFREVSSLAARHTPLRQERDAWDRLRHDFPEDDPLTTRDDELRARATAILARFDADQPDARKPAWAARIDRDDYSAWAEIDRGGYLQRLRWCPPGDFNAGSAADAPGHRDEEGAHRVRLTQGFWMADSEMTNQQWRALMKSGGDAPADAPAVGVSWDDAANACRALAALIGQDVRLPSEAEWEYACRAGVDEPAPAELGDFAWTRRNAAALKAVRTKRANRWGLYDLRGNALEWCQDWYGPYPAANLVDPIGPAQGADRVCRGGTCDGPERDCRAAARFHLAPETRFPNLGLRVIIPAPSALPTAIGDHP